MCILSWPHNRTRAKIFTCEGYKIRDRTVNKGLLKVDILKSHTYCISAVKSTKCNHHTG